MSRTQIKFVAITLFILTVTMLPALVALAGWASGGGD
jgi:hypothetical protein